MSPRQQVLLRSLLILAFVLLAAPLAHACPNCKDGVAQGDGSHSGLAQGFFWSILWMLSMPVLILTGLGSYFYLLVRRARQAAAATALTSAQNSGSLVPNPAGVSGYGMTASPAARRPNSLPTWEELMARSECDARA
ncbi:MAG: hypothetical protein ACKPEY_09220 [Planctomycetota bacterium]